ncbi:MAG TPA: T9SS type A sorting domain-containing protein [Saprospiraceae bacterium]|nr:T9SS type A sorting domain-containing protein [Saprospiraceae bacterium]
MKKSIITIFILSISLNLFGQCFPERHSTNWFDAWVSCETSISPNSSKSHWIMYELDALYKIDKFKIWNINDPSHLEWGTKNLLIEYSEDGNNWFIADSFVLTKATGTNDYEGDDWIDLNIPKAKFLLLTSLTNFKGDCHGFSEIKFSAEKIKLNTTISYEKNKMRVVVTPNPFSNQIEVNINSSLNGSCQIEILNSLGQNVYNNIVMIDNYTFHQTLDLKHLKSGIYHFQIKQKSVKYSKNILKL